MTGVARVSGLTREALYKALRPSAQPRFDTIARVCGALGVQLVARPVQANGDSKQVNTVGEADE